MAEDILQRIVATKKTEVAAAEADMPLDFLRRLAGMEKNRRPFLERLREPGPHGVNIIAEIKRASPSKGMIRPDLNPAVYARAYQAGGAAAMSVLTDQSYFHGGFEDLIQAREVSALPALRKDFLISEYQIYQSAVQGADAVLFIVRILTPDQLRDFLAIAEDLGLDALVEVHDEPELDTALEAGAKLVGVNNRNLRSFETSLDTAVGLREKMGAEVVAVAESGIHNREDILRLNEAGFHNFLVGESIVRAPDPEFFLRELMGAPEPEDDPEEAVESGGSAESNGPGETRKVP